MSLQESNHLMGEQLQNPPNNERLSKGLATVMKILDKPFESRNGSENNILYQFIEQNTFLNKTVSEVSREFVRNLMKWAHIKTIKKNKILATKGTQIQIVGIILDGRIAVYNTQENDGRHSFDKEDLWHKLISKPIQHKEPENRKRRNSRYIPNQNCREQNFNDFEDNPQSKFWSLASSIMENEQYGFSDLVEGTQYMQNYVTEQDSVLLIFDKVYLTICIQQAQKSDIRDLIYKLKSIRCFSFLESDKLNKIISQIQYRKAKRGDYIYRQGQKVEHFFFLSQGEIKLIKDTKLFEQNPNELYLNRGKLVEQSILSIGKNKKMDKHQTVLFERKVKKSILPYANLKKMYNYQPAHRNIQIGVINPFCLFGEQEYLEDKKRETSTKCNSFDCDYLEIEIKKLQQALGQKTWPLFLEELTNSLRKKILYRQKQYSSNIEIKNRNSMDYFYLNKEKQKQSPRRIRLSKFNSMIQPIRSSTPRDQHYRQTKSRQQLARPIQKRESIPRYTSFNFNRLVKQQNDGEDEQQVSYKQEQEINIMNVTHTWKLMKKKVDFEVRTSRKISPQKHVINLKTPLIEAQYFYHVEKEKKRIEKEHRKKILSLGRSLPMTRRKSIKP